MAEGRSKRATTKAAEGSAKKKEKFAFGFDLLDPKEIEDIAEERAAPTETQLRRIYGQDCMVIHPATNTAEECKSNQKGNPSCFGGLGWKVKKKKEGTGQVVDESSLVRGEGVFGGLKNLGATCYMNSILQCLFFNRSFRNGVFRLADDSVMPRGLRENWPPLLELQRLFAELKASCAKSYDPRPFTECLQLSTSIQQDAQEFLKLLLTYLEERLQSCDTIPADLRQLVQDNYRGTYAYCTRCKSCKNCSKVSVSFYDLDLTVQGLSRLEECLDDFFKTEELSGENKYQCEKCADKVEASRGIELQELPRFLNLQLLRFVFDIKSGNRKKVHNFITFPKTLDLAKHWPDKGEGAGGAEGGERDRKRAKKEGGDGASYKKGPGSNGSEHLLYDLQAVVLHTGQSALHGHYIAHVKDDASGEWWRFDDDSVSSLRDDEWFGSDKAVEKAMKKRKEQEQVELAGRIKSKEAYMLIYRRREPEREREGEREGEVGVPSGLLAAIKAASEHLELQHQENMRAHREQQLELREWDTFRENLFNSLPCRTEEEVVGGFYVTTDWLKHWVSTDPKDLVDQVDLKGITSQYGRADPSKVAEMKLVRKDAWYTIKEQYKIAEDSTELPASELCVQSVIDECQRRKTLSTESDIQATLKVLLAETPHVSEAGAVWVSKVWSREVVAGKGKARQDDPDGEQVRCDGSGSQDEESKAECARLAQMTPDKALRRLISKEAWEFISQNSNQNSQSELLKLKPLHWYPAEAEACSVCTDALQRSLEQEKVVKAERNEFKRRFKTVYEGFGMKVKPGVKYYLVAEQWIDLFQMFLQTTEAARPPPIDNRPLLLSSAWGDDVDGQLIYDPLDLSQPKVPFSWVAEDDYMELKKEFGGGPDISVVVLSPDSPTQKLLQVYVNRQPAKGSASYRGRLEGSTDPPVSEKALQNRERFEASAQLEYNQGTLNIVQGGGAGAGWGAEAGRAGGGRRLRVRKGETQLEGVKCSDTIQAIKVKIYEALHVSPADQTLMHEGEELSDPTKTLFEYRVPTGATLRVQGRMEDVEEASARDKAAAKQREEEAGFSGTALSGLGLPSTSAAQPIEVEDDSPSDPPARPKKEGGEGGKKDKERKGAFVSRGGGGGGGGGQRGSSSNGSARPRSTNGNGNGKKQNESAADSDVEVDEFTAAVRALAQQAQAVRPAASGGNSGLKRS